MTLLGSNKMNETSRELYEKKSNIKYNFNDELEYQYRCYEGRLIFLRDREHNLRF